MSAKNFNQRVMDSYVTKHKREERTTEEIEYEKNQAELTFKPKLSTSQPVLEHLRVSDVSPANMQRNITYNNLGQQKSYGEKSNIKKSKMESVALDSLQHNFKPIEKTSFDPYQRNKNSPSYDQSNSNINDDKQPEEEEEEQ